MTTRPTSKRGQTYWELIELIFPMVKRGDSTKKMARAAKAQGLKKRDGSNIDVGYIAATISNKKLREAPSLELVIGTWPPKKRTRKPAPAAQDKSDLYAIALASDQSSEVKLRLVEEINRGEWTQSSRVEVERDHLGDFRIVEHSLANGRTEVTPLGGRVVRIILAAVPQIEALL